MQKHTFTNTTTTTAPAGGAVACVFCGDRW
jgi:hypothetical protein